MHYLEFEGHCTFNNNLRQRRHHEVSSFKLFTEHKKVEKGFKMIEKCLKTSDVGVSYPFVFGPF